MEKLEPTYIAIGKQPAISSKDEHRVTKVCAQEKWKHISIQNMYMNVYTALFIIAKKWKQPKYLWTDEWISKIPYNGILFSNKKDLVTDTCDKIHECWKHAKSVTKDQILRDSIYMKCSEQANI